LTLRPQCCIALGPFVSPKSSFVTLKLLCDPLNTDDYIVYTSCYQGRVWD